MIHRTTLGRALAIAGQRFTEAPSLLVAYSGGRDSHALLHAAKHNSSLPVQAVHINHGLQDDSVVWVEHCRGVCEQLQVPLTVLAARVERSGQGPEAAARNARYSLFEQHLAPKQVLLQAHHADDQAETLLLRLMRGTGLRGMAAMPEMRPLGQGVLWRPLLAISQQDINAYAIEHGLEFVEDPSNCDQTFDRNYLRHQVMPLLSRRWPVAAKQMAATARRAQQAEELLQQLLKPKLEALCAEDGSLCCAGFLMLPKLQQPHVLRVWLARQTELAPSEAQLHAMIGEVIAARRDADPQLGLNGGVLRRHRERLYWVVERSQDLPEVTKWPDFEQPLQLGEQSLSLQSAFGRRICVPAGACVEVRFRRGGERIKLRAGSRSLKRHLQDRAVPSWLRDTTPLLFIDDELAAVWNISVADEFSKS